MRSSGASRSRKNARSSRAADNKPDEGEQGQAGAEASEQQGTMSEEEARRWLSTLKEDRAEYLKRKFEGQRRYQVEKDW